MIVISVRRSQKASIGCSSCYSYPHIVVACLSAFLVYSLDRHRNSFTHFSQSSRRVVDGQHFLMIVRLHLRSALDTQSKCAHALVRCATTTSHNFFIAQCDVDWSLPQTRKRSITSFHPHCGVVTPSARLSRARCRIALGADLSSELHKKQRCEAMRKVWKTIIASRVI